ncbi:class I SAM-dependent methyltransferase [Paenibacillus sp.]|jgi:ubiquinone/menaquinone biosynthesis C-methylase UbiE|uniref:class I SAM-dependent methyltransferase n=1 Tax=Paenibacillus sp. TaxID=58172 RepID=UPI0028399126|nr:class I SAM-dependent methyltransferase [Paenibacillus sp.]MDR0269970.1 class I SAM-dependent methyltransferase [Paenibacillus sp.]
MDKIISYYNNFDEWGRLEREPIEFIINMHHIQSLLPPEGHILDNGAGPGKYSIELAKRGYRVTLTDLTSRSVEIAENKAKEFQVEDRFDGFYSADARDLGLFSDNRFDAALMLGPLYHLQAEADRVQAVRELHRVTKPGGLVFAAFMTKTKFLTNSLMHPEHWKPNHTIEGIQQFLQTGTFDHEDEGRFTGAYYFDIAEITSFMESQGFETVKLIGSSSIAGAMTPEQWEYWSRQGDETYRQIMDIIMKESENPYLLGSASHLLYIGRKI